MSITPIGPHSGWQISSPQPSNWQNVLSAASSALGLSREALQQQLRTGQSLSAIAHGQGVAQPALIAAISGALQQSGRLSGASAGQLAQIATQLAHRTPGGQRR
jgi:hypothetical protein